MRSSLRALACALLLGLSLARPPSAEGQSNGIIHRVTNRGESYEDLAEHYYGKRYLAMHLKLQNGRPEPLSPGTSIIIPTYNVVPVKRGQTLAQFAEAYQSNARRADYIAELHGLRGKERVLPKPGTRLRVVPSLPHRVRPGESLRTIARLYYRDAGPERLKLLGLFNSVTEATLRSAASIRIPLDMPEFNHALVAARAKKPIERSAPEAVAAMSKAAADRALLDKAAAVKRKTATTRPPAEETAAPPSAGSTVATDPIAARPAEADDLNTALEAIERACGDGEYERCEADAKKLSTEMRSAPSAVRVELLSMRAVALIALGRPDESKEVFRALLKLDPEYDLDLYRTSPKVLDVFQAVAER